MNKYEKISFCNKIFNKAIKTKFKVVFQFLTSIKKIDIYCYQKYKKKKR